MQLHTAVHKRHRNFSRMRRSHSTLAGLVRINLLSVHLHFLHISWQNTVDGYKQIFVGVFESFIDNPHLSCFFFIYPYNPLNYKSSCGCHAFTSLVVLTSIRCFRQIVSKSEDSYIKPVVIKD